MRYLTLRELVALQRRIIAVTGGASGIRDLGALESAVAQPRASFGSEDLYPGVIEKAAALGFSLVMASNVQRPTSNGSTLSRAAQRPPSTGRSRPYAARPHRATMRRRWAASGAAPCWAASEPPHSFAVGTALYPVRPFGQ